MPERKRNVGAKTFMQRSHYIAESAQNIYYLRFYFLVWRLIVFLFKNISEPSLAL